MIPSAFRRRDVLTALAAASLAGCTRAGDEQPAPVAAPQDVAPSLTTLDTANLSSFLQDELTRSGAPGIALAIVGPHGVRELAVAGVRAADKPDLIHAEDPWHIGSDTKAMTGALYARLVDRGEARWGVSVASLFPQFAGKTAKAWDDITIEQLMAHRSGLDHLGANWILGRQFDNRPLTEQRAETALNALSEAPKGEIGAFAYTNVAFIIAGAAIETITGQSWEEAITRHVFEPLDMRSAGFGPPQGGAPEGHMRSLFGKQESAGTGKRADNPPALGPAGTVHVSLEDWAKFTSIFLDPAQTFLKPETLAHLTTPVGENSTYANGWGVVAAPGGERMLSHDGSNTMWYARAALLPERGAGFLYTMNCGPNIGADSARRVQQAVLPLLQSEG
ncbi:MAG: serine hydrolase domain-containing protein [Hyphomonadaceae bacterium]